VDRSNAKTSLVSLALAVLAAGCYVTLDGTQPEDVWEENDDFVAADANADLTGFEGRRLTEIDAGGGVISWDDDDYFKVTAPAGATRLLVQCEFGHAWGDVDVQLYAGDQTFLAEATSADADESIDFDLAADSAFYVYVSLYDGGQNAYDLWWCTVAEVDPHEPDDSDADATPAVDEAWLSDGGGPWPYADGLDEDWYLVTLASGQDTVEVFCDFYEAFGDLEAELVSFDGVDWVSEAASTGPGDGEHILAAGLAPGDYYVVVYGAAGAGVNVYDLHVDVRP